MPFGNQTFYQSWRVDCCQLFQVDVVYAELNLTVRAGGNGFLECPTGSTGKRILWNRLPVSKQDSGA